MKKLGYGLALMLAAAALFLLPASAMAAVGDTFQVQCKNAKGETIVPVSFMITKESDEGNEVSVGAGIYKTPAVESTIQSVIIPEQVMKPNSFTAYKVTSIAPYAFYQCRDLTAITLPTTIKSIGDYAFAYCDQLMIRGNWLPDSLQTIGEYAFVECSALKLYSLPSDVTSIGNAAFSNCEALALTNIPDGISLGSEAFAHCHSLAIQTMPTGVSDASAKVFHDCRSITRMTIPAGVSTIPDKAFLSCINLASLAFASQTPPAIEAEAFQSVRATGALYVPIGATANYTSFLTTHLPQGWKLAERASLSGQVLNADSTPLVAKKVFLYDQAG